MAPDALRRVVALALAVSLAAAGAWYATPKRAADTDDAPLQTAAGTLRLSDLRGSVVLLYFGYTSCPDVCPTSLAYMGTALASLDAEELAHTRGVFVSLDPERDAPARLQAYAAHFHPNIVGATAPDATLRVLTVAWDIAWRRHGVEGALGYVVDHTSVTQVLRPDGALHARLAHGAAPDAIVAAIRGAR